MRLLWISSAVASLGVTSLGACSSSATESPSGPDPAEDASSGAKDASEAVDGGTASDGGGDGGKGEPGDLFPRKVGNQWTYETVGSATACPAGRHMAEVLSHANECGVPVIEWTSYCVTGRPNSFLYTSAPGDDVRICSGGTLDPMFGSPVKDGTTWTYFGSSYSWHRVTAPVKVPAGTFDDCWMVKENSTAVLYEATYCRGVGLVRHRQQQVQVDITVELQSKNF